MIAHHGIPCKDRRKIFMHEKDITDGDGAATSKMVKGSFSDNYGNRTHNLVNILHTSIHEQRLPGIHNTMTGEDFMQQHSTFTRSSLQMQLMSKFWQWMMGTAD
jgi:hypothetical protein